MSVFISYSSKDSAFVGQLAAELIKRRIKVWVDKFEMKPGDSLIDKIQEGLDNSDHLVVVLSKNSVESNWCKKELNSIMMSEIDEGRNRIVPILIEDCVIPVFLREKLYANFKDDFNYGLSELMRSLAHLNKEKSGRSNVGGATVDYGANWDIVEDKFTLYLDFVVMIDSQQKSVILQVIFTGNDVATERYKMQVENGMNYLMKEMLIMMLCENPIYRDLNPIVSTDKPFVFKSGLGDPQMDILFDVTIRGVLLGVDNGNDIILNFIDYIEILEETKEARRQEIWNKYR